MKSKSKNVNFLAICTKNHYNLIRITSYYFYFFSFYPMAKFFGWCFFGFLIWWLATYRVMQYALLSSYWPMIQSLIQAITTAQDQWSVDTLLQGTIDQQKAALDALILSKKAELDTTIRTMFSNYLHQKIQETIWWPSSSSSLQQTQE